MIMVAHRVSVNRGAQIIQRSPYRSVLPQPLTAMRAMSVLYLFAMGAMFGRSEGFVAPLAGRY